MRHKRSSDTRICREVVGQMLDYAADTVAYWPRPGRKSGTSSRTAANRRAVRLSPRQPAEGTCRHRFSTAVVPMAQMSPEAFSALKGPLQPGSTATTAMTRRRWNSLCVASRHPRDPQAYRGRRGFHDAKSAGSISSWGVWRSGWRTTPITHCPSLLHPSRVTCQLLAFVPCR